MVLGRLNQELELNVNICGMTGKQASKVQIGTFYNECQARRLIKFLDLDIG